MIYAPRTTMNVFLYLFNIIEFIKCYKSNIEFLENAWYIIETTGMVPQLRLDYNQELKSVVGIIQSAAIEKKDADQRCRIIRDINTSENHPKYRIIFGKQHMMIDNIQIGNETYEKNDKWEFRNIDGPVFKIMMQNECLAIGDYNENGFYRLTLERCQDNEKDSKQDFVIWKASDYDKNNLHDENKIAQSKGSNGKKRTKKKFSSKKENDEISDSNEDFIDTDKEWSKTNDEDEISDKDEIFKNPKKEKSVRRNRIETNDTDDNSSDSEQIDKDNKNLSDKNKPRKQKKLKTREQTDNENITDYESGPKRKKHLNYMKPESEYVVKKRENENITDYESNPKRKNHYNYMKPEPEYVVKKQENKNINNEDSIEDEKDSEAKSQFDEEELIKNNNDHKENSHCNEDVNSNDNDYGISSNGKKYVKCTFGNGGDDCKENIEKDGGCKTDNDDNKIHKSSKPKKKVSSDSKEKSEHKKNKLNHANDYSKKENNFVNDSNKKLFTDSNILKEPGNKYSPVQMQSPNHEKVETKHISTNSPKSIEISPKMSPVKSSGESLKTNEKSNADKHAAPNLKDKNAGFFIPSKFFGS